MNKRSVSVNHLRDIVRARMTKGDAFRLNHQAYMHKQREVAKELACMGYMEILNKWPQFTFDIKRLG